jgi:hypothetical protein
VESQRQFAEIKLRACVKIGEIRRDLEKAQGHRANDGTKSKEEILRDAGIAKRTAYNYEELSGSREEQAMQIASAAMETYFAGCAQRGEQVSYKALRSAVIEVGEAAFHRSRNPGNYS